MIKKLNKTFGLIIFSFFLLIPFSVVKADYLNQQVSFFVDSNFSKDEINKVNATLKGNYSNLYFYFEDSWWDNRKQEEYADLFLKMDKLSAEFNNNIYPKLTSFFGPEANPGIDNDKKITVLFYSTKDNVKGYVRNIDEYEPYVNPQSNKREIIYMNIDNINSSFLYEYFAHEFMHLVVLNSKELKNNISEETWLSEAYSEYAITFLGYNKKDNSYLDVRVKDFTNNSLESPINWKGDIYSYGSVNVFIHYLVDQYGENLLAESLKNDKVGIESISEALLKLKIKDSFNEIFRNWTIAVYLNNCDISEKYCFKTEKLKNLNVVPYVNFLPLFGENSLYLGQYLENYSAHWQKFSGSNSTLEVNFKNNNNNQFLVSYIIKTLNGNIEVGKMFINSSKEGKLIIENMKEISYVIVIPTALKNTGESFYSITASTIQNNTEQNNDQTSDTILPFETDKPLTQMNREELLSVLLRLIIYLILQGKLVI